MIEKNYETINLKKLRHEAVNYIYNNDLSYSERLLLKDFYETIIKECEED